MRTTRPLPPIPQVYLLSHDKSQQIHPALPPPLINVPNNLRILAIIHIEHIIYKWYERLHLTNTEDMLQ